MFISFKKKISHYKFFGFFVFYIKLCQICIRMSVINFYTFIFSFFVMFCFGYVYSNAKLIIFSCKFLGFYEKCEKCIFQFFFNPKNVIILLNLGKNIISRTNTIYGLFSQKLLRNR